MNLSTQPYKGARDFYPEDKRLQKYMFGVLRKVVESFGYQEYDAPILEPFEIYAAKTGEEIVNEQLYSFEDKGGRKVAIRPEMTPSVSRMVAARRQELSYPLRLYSIPNLWRYERPQHGRLREHWQLNVDIFGVKNIRADYEIIMIADRILKSFNAVPAMYQIRINSRKAVDEALVQIGLNSQQITGVLRLIDKSAKLAPEAFSAALSEQIGEDTANKVLAYLNSPTEPPQEVKMLLRMLELAGVSSATYDRSVARGFDYYTDIVFEVYDSNPENNRSMFGGGRYDGLVQLFGAEALPVVGFGMGDVTLQNFLESHNLLPNLQIETDAVVILIGDVFTDAQPVIRELRNNGLNIAVDISDRKLDAQIKSAVKSGARYAIFIGEKELESQQFKLRDLEKGEEKDLSLDQIASTLSVRHSE
ncbi:MAG: histidine--tRNA ligase [Candidatus Saccharimonadales bacterium]